LELLLERLRDIGRVQRTHRLGLVCALPPGDRGPKKQKRSNRLYWPTRLQNSFHNALPLSAVAAVCDRWSALPSRAGFERRYNLCRSVIRCPQTEKGRRLWSPH